MSKLTLSANVVVLFCGTCEINGSLGTYPLRGKMRLLRYNMRGKTTSEVEEEQDEDEEDPLDMDFIDSEYEQIGEAEEIEIDNNMFGENIDNPIEEKPEEMGFAGEISDHLENSEDFHSKHGYDEFDVDDEVSSKKKKTKVVPNYRQWRRESLLRNPSFDIGMHFPNKSQFKEAVI
ncbi:unnamed protein product, partial [Prunus brigantina]